jgi:hypothetical protein
MNNPLVHIILVNYGNWQDTIECLESIKLNSYKFYKVIVVDVGNLNHSVYHLLEWINNQSDDNFLFIQQKENKGFAAANNLGIRAVIDDMESSFFWVLNNDTSIERNSLKELLGYYKENENNKDIGFLGSKILDYKNRDIIQTVGGTFNPWTGYSILTGMGQIDRGQFDAGGYKNDYVIGASMFFHKSLLDKIGLMSEEYFLYYEDLDWCIAAKKAGFQNITCNKSIVYHKQGQATGAKLIEDDASLRNKKYLYSSYLKFYRKHFPLQVPIAYLILVKQYAGKLYRKKFKEARVILNTIISIPNP